MTVVPALLAGVSVFLLVTGRRGSALASRVGRYVAWGAAPVDAPTDDGLEPPVAFRQAGLPWTAATVRARRAAAVAGGVLAGLLVAQGDLVVASGTAPLATAVVGGSSGLLAFSIWLTQRRKQRAVRLRQELPVIADTIALHVVAGESVATALEMVITEARGVAVDELGVALRRYRRGRSLAEALVAAGRDTLHPDAGRLYTLLGNAHETGGRLADGLAELAADYRAALARDLTSEGGRRALAMYGPILALMVPVALLFLMYPTLTGLTELSGNP